MRNKWAQILLIAICLTSCNNINKENNFINEITSDSVRIFTDSVINGKAMAWDNFQLSIRAYDSINSDSRLTREFYFGAAIKMFKKGDAMLSSEISKNVLKYIQTKPDEFVESISKYQIDSISDIPIGVGIKLNEIEKQNALIKAKDISEILRKSYDNNDTLKDKKVSRFLFIMMQPIKAMQNPG